MKRAVGKSHCPINFTLEHLGDQWSLLIMRDMLFFGKRHYKDFLTSPEGIATNILADRLVKLEKLGIIEKLCDRYLPTQKGLDLVPVLTEIGLWGAKYDPETATPHELVHCAKKNPKLFREKFSQFSR